MYLHQRILPKVTMSLVKENHVSCRRCGRPLSVAFSSPLQQVVEQHIVRSPVISLRTLGSQSPAKDGDNGLPVPRNNQNPKEIRCKEMRHKIVQDCSTFYGVEEGTELPAMLNVHRDL